MFQNLLPFSAVSLLLLLLAASGCTTNSSANARAQAAFAAGQQAGTAQAQAAPKVSFRGDVKKSSVPWSEELTLARALLAAEYTGLWDPHRIVIIRKGETFKIDPRRLLSGLDDPLLEPGDTVEIHR